MHGASVERKQMHGTDFHCVEVVIATVTATGSTEKVLFFYPLLRPESMSIV